jgi:hypothetical protein
MNKYEREMNKLSDRLWEDLCKTIDKCMEREIFIKEDLGGGEFWYKLPDEVYVAIPNSNDLGRVDNFTPEGDIWTKYEKAPRGGLLYTDHDYAEVIETCELNDNGRLDLLEGLNRLLGDPINSDYHVLIT